MKRESYDARQTALCNSVRARLRAIAAQAIEAQDLDPSGDPLADLIMEIGADLDQVRELNRRLSRDDV